MDVEAIEHFGQQLLSEKSPLAQEIYDNAARKNIIGTSELLYVFYARHHRFGTLMAQAVRNQLKTTEPMDIFTPGKGGLAAELLQLTFRTPASIRYTQLAFESVIEEADCADTRDPQSLMDLAKQYFRSVDEYSALSPLEMKEAFMAITTEVSKHLVQKIKKNGEFVSENTKISCQQRAGLLLRSLAWKHYAFPAFKEAALKSQFPIKRSVIKFLNKFILFTLNGDIAPLRRFFDRYHDPKAFEKKARKYAEKCRMLVYSTGVKMSKPEGIKAQRGAFFITSASEVAQREETRAVALFNLFQTAYTYRLCEFTQNMEPKAISDLKSKLLARKRTTSRVSRTPSLSSMLNALPDLRAIDVSTVDAMDESSQDNDRPQQADEDWDADSDDSDSPRSMSAKAGGRTRNSLTTTDSISRSSSGSNPSCKPVSTSSLSAITESEEDFDSGAELKRPKNEKIDLGLSMAEVMDVKLRTVDREATVADVLCKGMVVAILLRQFG
eukprot:TRINITY_DN6251_c0_g1_i1.p1 TRINITY_DN6251_c0_g1~~TRINITY_DN6251_c0_g1_i1.p1  ORF type:complete len:497 (-),score=74.97 TRINITY_DN6251_c0_g1_i1:1260-2750(-)